MCKILQIKHACRHAVNFHLSECLGAFASNTTPPSRPRKNCRQTPYIRVYHSNCCGDCIQQDTEVECDCRRQQVLLEMEAIQKRLDDPNADWRLMENDANELEQARKRLLAVDEANHEIVSGASRAFPGTSDYVDRRKIVGRRRVRGSLLRTEVHADMVEASAKERGTGNGWCRNSMAQSCGEIARAGLQRPGRSGSVEGHECLDSSLQADLVQPATLGGKTSMLGEVGGEFTEV